MLLLTNDGFSADMLWPTEKSECPTTESDVECNEDIDTTDDECFNLFLILSFVCGCMMGKEILFL